MTCETGAQAKAYRLFGPRLVLIAVLGVIALGALNARSAESGRETQLSGLSVSVTPARKMCFKSEVEVTGFVVPHQEVEIAPPRDGLRVAEVLVEPLDQVTIGQTLARLAPLDESAQAGATVLLRSTAAGIVGRIDAMVGAPALVRQPLFKIYAGGDLDLQAQASMADMKKLAVGQKAAVRALGQPETSGKVQAIADQVEPANQLARVRISLTANRDLRVGTFGRGIIEVGERCGVGAPYSAIMYQPDGTILHVVKNDRVEARKVTIGLLSGAFVEVRSGVSADDIIVTRAGPFLRDGDQVKSIPVNKIDASHAVPGN